jgi:GrpB-like predicted nucleotidyltransferase (UPF0157 family)/SAM-dependent methyltransferase
LLGIFGDSVLRISHIGSTAVPNLIAKPTIDILLEVKEDTDLTSITEILTNMGYVVNTPKSDIIVYLKGYTSQGFVGQAFHIHVRHLDDWDNFYFRDYLIEHPETAKEYGELKQKLLTKFENDRDGYTAAKSEFIGRITALAREELKGKYAPNKLINHYDKLIDENIDPVRDVKVLRDYMDKWDGQVFIDELLLDKNKTALEFAVGTGRLAIKTIPYCKHFTGIDISPKTIKRAEENLAEFINKTLICADFLEYEFAEKFDVIYSSLTFLHIQEKQKVINKNAELLNNGGRFVLSLDKEHKGNKIDYGNRTLTIYPDTPQEIMQYIKNAGLAVVGEKELEFAWIIVAEKEH